jgi:hypothetical protein
MGSGLIQHGLQEVNPRMGMRWRHATELSLHCLTRLLFHIRQHEELCGGSCGSRTMVVCTVTTARTGVPINGAVL